MSPTTSYVISSALWSVAGLAVGYIAGLVTAARCQREHVPEGMPPPHQQQRFGRAIGVLVLVMAVVSVCTAAVTIDRQSALVACQTEFNQRFVASLEGRAASATQERAAQRTLLTTQYTTPEAWQVAKAAYLQALDRADAYRDANPLPEQPRC